MAEMLSIGQAAELLGVTRETLRNWESKGKINVSRTLGNERRYSVDEIQRIMGDAEIPSADRDTLAVKDQIRAIKAHSGETAINRLHYSNRITDPAVRAYLVDSYDDPDQLSLRGTIAVTDALLSIHTKRFDEEAAHSEKAWKRAQVAFNRLRLAQKERDEMGVSDALDELEEIFFRKNRMDHEASIIALQEHRVELVTAEVNRLKVAGEFLTAEEAMRITAEKLQAILSVVRERCAPEVQRAVVDATRKKT